MAKREVVGLGSLWEDDNGKDDLCGLFIWKLEVWQDSGVISTDLTITSGDGGEFYDGYYSLTSAVKLGEKDVLCQTEDGTAPGKRVLIASGSTAKGRNASFSVSGSGSLSSGSLGVSYSPGYAGQKLDWKFKIEICPGFDDCPDIKILQNITSVSDTEYFWGDLLRKPRDNESDQVRRQQPQVLIGDCDVVIDELANRKLPAFDRNGVDTDTATALNV